MGSVMGLFRRRFILIVDDDRDLAIILCMLLNLVGFDVVVAYNGYEALAIARTGKPDVLILDIGLPGLDGQEFARQFRSDDRLKTVLIIAHSAYSPDTAPGRSHEGIFDHHLVKPVDFETLLPLLGRPG
jgi:DNA-binding response OmpR family regulator